MRRRPISVMLALIYFVAIVARADKVTADYDHAVDFFKYKTFMWISEPDTQQPFMKERIMAAVNSQLAARGLRLVHDGADLAIGAHLATEERQTWETYYSGSDWSWGSGWATTTVKTYEVGTLTVDLFDTNSKKLIWQGVGVDTLSHKPEKRTRGIDKEIGKMFKEFPPVP
jgi:hypothetical protein